MSLVESLVESLRESLGTLFGRLFRRVFGGSTGRLVGLSLVALLLAACSNEAGTQTAPSTVASSLANVSEPRSTTTPTTTMTAVSVSNDPPPTAAPEPTGVRGLDDDDPFCAEWAVYSGTLQAIGVAGAFGDVGSAEIAGLEVVAAASVTHAIEGIGSHWPAELASERNSVLDDLLGAFGRRAQKALAAVRDAGATDDHIGQLQLAWDAALRTRDPEQPVIGVPALPADLVAIVATAAAAFDAAVTPFADDPSLQVGTVQVPLTDDYLAAHCPDLASIGVGDAV